MTPLTGLLLLVVTVIGMEAVAYSLHRWVMHGPGWFLHRSHHRPRDGWYEHNDWYAVIFAGPSILLIYGALHWGWWSGLAWIGTGVAAYGLIYFVFHDLLVHRRIPHRFVAKSGYLKRIMQAHRLHHAVGDKDGAVSFGFLWAPAPQRLKQKLKRGEPQR